MVDAAVREWLRQIMSNEVAIEGVGNEIRTMFACFYADDGLVACRDPDLLQRALDRLTSLFYRPGLCTNTKKTECMTFLSGKIRTCLTVEGTVPTWTRSSGKNVWDGQQTAISVEGRWQRGPCSFT